LIDHIGDSETLGFSQ